MDSAHAHRDRLGVGRQPHCLGAGDHFLVVEVEQVLVEPLHAAVAGGDIVAQLADPVFHDVFGRDRPAAENLHGGAAAVAVTRDGQALRDDRLERKGQL